MFFPKAAEMSQTLMDGQDSAGQRKSEASTQVAWTSFRAGKHGLVEHSWAMAGNRKID